MAIQALEKFYDKEIKITKELRDFMADTFTHKVYIKWQHQANLLKRLTLNAMGDELYKEVEDAAGGKEAFEKKVFVNAAKNQFKAKNIAKQLDAQTNFEGVDKVQQKNAQNMTSALKRDMEDTSDGVVIIAIGTAFYHKMDRKTAKAVYEEGTENILEVEKTKTVFHSAMRVLLKQALYYSNQHIKSIADTSGIDLDNAELADPQKAVDRRAAQLTHGAEAGGFDDSGPKRQFADPVTVARMKLAKGWNGMKKRMEVALDNLKNKEVANFAVSVGEHMQRQLWMQYKIKDLTKAKGMILDQTTVIEMELNGVQDFAEMSDRSGILRMTRESLDKIKDRMLKRMKDSKKFSEGEISGSPTKKVILERMAKRHLIEELLKSKHAKGKADLRLKVNKKLLSEARKEINSRKSGKTQGKQTPTRGRTKRTRGKGVAAVGAVAASRRTRGKGKVDQQAGANPLALKELLNEVLPQEVARRMQSPALNYRTGRFANSAEVTDVLVGPKGGLQSIDYTYMRNPYETFEPGGKQGSIQRDPKKLIGGTIRELAIGMLQRKFIPTRRV